MLERDRDSYQPGNITQQGMTFLIRGPAESEIAVLSFSSSQAAMCRAGREGEGAGQGP